MGFDISQITDQLFVSAWPGAGSAVRIDELAIELVVSATRPPRASRETIARWVRAPAVDSPLTPIPLRNLIRGVEAALPVLRNGGRVLTHCREGRHRSVAQAACILIALGWTADDAMALLCSRRAVADPHAFWIKPRIRLFERVWTARQAALTAETDTAFQATG